MKVLIICIVTFACAVGAMDVCTGLKKLHSDNGCCGGTGDAVCVANSAQHYLGTRSHKVTTNHESYHHFIKRMDTLTFHEFEYKCPSNDTWTHREKVASHHHGEEGLMVVTVGGSFYHTSPSNVTILFNAKNNHTCISRPESSRRIFEGHDGWSVYWKQTSGINAYSFTTNKYCNVESKIVPYCHSGQPITRAEQMWCWEHEACGVSIMASYPGQAASIFANLPRGWAPWTM